MYVLYDRKYTMYYHYLNIFNENMFCGGFGKNGFVLHKFEMGITTCMSIIS